MNFTLVFILLISIGCLVYAYLILKFIQGLQNLKNQQRILFQEFPSASIIIAARNEAMNLRRTLESLLSQNYDGEWEIILVNDRSTDETEQILSEMICCNPRLKVITISEETSSPKKYALAKGIEKSNGEIIVTTDADCIHSKNWLQNLISYLTEETGVVAGLTLFETHEAKNPMWQKIQQLDFFALNVLAAGSMGENIPACCNGSNLAYRREVYNEISGFHKQSHVVSGDDVLFVQQVSRSTKWKITFATDAETYVRSLPVSTFKNLIHQRLRWASKGLHYCGSMSVFLFGTYLFFSLFIAAPFVMMLSSWSIPYLAFAFCWKLSWDYFLIYFGTKIFHQQKMRSVFIPYFLSVTIAAPFIGFGGLIFPYQWKDKWYYPLKTQWVRINFHSLANKIFRKPYQTVTEE